MHGRHHNSRAALAFGMTLALALGVLAAGSPVLAAGPAAVGLGTAASYAILAGTPEISNTGATTVTGDIGIHPGAAITGFPPGTVSGTTHPADAAALQAQSDLVIAYDDAAGRPPSATHAVLGNLTLVAGVYTAGGATLDLTGPLTLDAQNDPNAVWIFTATSDLVTASGSTVNLINGAQACNVFWQVTSSATLGSGSTMRGTIMALTSITMAAGVNLEGRALARNGLVSMISDTVTVPACAAPIASASAIASAASPAGSGGGVVPTIPPTDTVRQAEPATIGFGAVILFLVLLAGAARLAMGTHMLRNQRR